MIALIDYGINNLRSVEKACQRVGMPVRLTANPDELARADKLILPGVGAFHAGMTALDSLGLARTIREAAARGVPILGICLGMQLLFDESEEMGTTAGLGLIPGRVTRMQGQGVKVPHMGWNRLRLRAPSPLLADLPDGSFAYFVHSYVCAPAESEGILASTDHGGEFAAAVSRRNVYGIQFHPEKSQSVGLRILENFARMETEEAWSVER